MPTLQYIVAEAMLLSVGVIHREDEEKTGRKEVPTGLFLQMFHALPSEFLCNKLSLD